MNPSDSKQSFFKDNTKVAETSADETYDWRSTKPQRDMIYDTAGKMSKKEASLWYKIGRAIIESRPSESNNSGNKSNTQPQGGGRS